MKVPNLMLASGLISTRRIGWVFILTIFLAPIGIYIRMSIKRAFYDERYFLNRKYTYVFLGFLSLLYPAFLIMFGKFVNQNKYIKVRKHWWSFFSISKYKLEKDEIKYQEMMHNKQLDEERNFNNYQQ